MDIIIIIMTFSISVNIIIKATYYDKIPKLVVICYATNINFVYVGSYAPEYCYFKHKLIIVY